MILESLGKPISRAAALSSGGDKAVFVFRGGRVIWP